MRLVTFCTLVLVAVSGVVAACGSSSSGSPADAQDGGVGSDSGGVPSEGGADASVKSDIPGDPATAVAAAVEVTINGQKRVFEGPATWTKFPSDGGTIVGFQTNAHSASDWTLVLAVFGNTPGTYSCSDSPRGGGLSLTNRILGDGGILADWTEYGGTVTSERCSITLVSYGSQQGDHVTGTFTGELDLSQGDAPITHLTLTAGKFDLVQSASVPP